MSYVPSIRGFHDLIPVWAGSANHLNERFLCTDMRWNIPRNLNHAEPGSDD